MMLDHVEWRNGIVGVIIVGVVVNECMMRELVCVWCGDGGE